MCGSTGRLAATPESALRGPAVPRPESQWRQNMQNGARSDADRGSWQSRLPAVPYLRVRARPPSGGWGSAPIRVQVAGHSSPLSILLPRLPARRLWAPAIHAKAHRLPRKHSDRDPARSATGPALNLQVRHDLIYKQFRRIAEYRALPGLITAPPCRSQTPQAGRSLEG